jgi:hypothetical protein
MAQLRGDPLRVREGTEREDEGNVAREVSDFWPGQVIVVEKLGHCKTRFFGNVQYRDIHVALRQAR